VLVSFNSNSLLYFGGLKHNSLYWKDASLRCRDRSLELHRQRSASRSYCAIYVSITLLKTLQDSSVPRGDGRGATIFTALQLTGDSTAIPANEFCNDLNNIFGNFDGRVRSLAVENGYRCRVYL
jgi:hypothetical protein